MRDYQRGAEVAMQGMSQALHLMTDNSAENKKYISAVLDTFSHTELLHQKVPTTRSQVWKSTWMQRILYGESTCKKMSQKEV